MIVFLHFITHLVDALHVRCMYLGYGSPLSMKSDDNGDENPYLIQITPKKEQKIERKASDGVLPFGKSNEDKTRTRK